MIESPLLQPEERRHFTAELGVESFERSLEFYTQKLGFSLNRIDRASKVAVLGFSGHILMIKEEPGLENRGSGFFLRFPVPDLDAYYQELQTKKSQNPGSSRGPQLGSSPVLCTRSRRLQNPVYPRKIAFLPLEKSNL